MTRQLWDAHAGFSASADDCVSDLDRIDNDLVHRDIRVRESAAKVKAFGYIWLAAAVERYVKESLGAVCNAINQEHVPLEELRPSLLSIAAASRFEALQELRKTEMWRRRVEICELFGSSDVCQFNVEMLPYDGRTVRGRHFDLFQSVFGYSQDHFASANERAALEDLAKGRNDVAHGHMAPVRFGRTKNILSVRRNFRQVVDVMDRFALILDQYVTNREYLR